MSNAHVVSDRTFVQVRRHGEARRYEARVLNVAHPADLALLTVDDPAFFEGVAPLELGELPAVQQEVLVYGFATGGDTLSTTKGDISRIEHQPYAHSSSHLLAGQIDAAINPGNSGGPVLVGERVVGVVMQLMNQANNIGYMVPVNVVAHFLEDIEDGRYDGIPSLGIVVQHMENPAMRRHHAMPEEASGVWVFKVLPGSPAEARLQAGDVLLVVDDYSVADDGTIAFRPGERTSLSYAVQAHQLGARLPLTILRGGAVRRPTVMLYCTQREEELIRGETFDVSPSYFIYGGLVFCPLSKNLLKAWGRDWYRRAPRRLVALLDKNFPEREGQEVVLLLKVLAAPVNQGYHEYANWIITRVDGEEVLNLRELVRRVERKTERPHLVFENDVGQQIVLDRHEVDASREPILRNYRISSDRSPDLLDLP